MFATIVLPDLRPEGRQSLSALVAEAVRMLIMSHVIAPDTPVNVDQLARDLKVSQTPIREALAKLESEGLLVRLSQRGYRTTELLGSDELDEIFDFRRTVEIPMAGRAAERATPEGVERLREELTNCPTRPDESEESYRRLGGHEARFHNLILEQAGSRLAVRAYDTTNIHFHVFRAFYNRPLDEHPATEHLRIVEAIAAGDAAEAERAMLDHLDRTRERLGAPVS